MPPSKIRVRRMQPAESRAVAALHAAGIPQGFLSRLGPGFRAAMYQGIANAPASGVWVAVTESDEIVGFVSGSANVARCYRAVLLHRGLLMAAHALPAAFRKSTWTHARETLSYPRREIAAASPIQDRPEPSAELLSIVVAPAGRGSGAASSLVAALEEGLRTWDHHGTYRVVTMAADPRSNAFYRKVGFRQVREFRHHGIPMNLYHKDIMP